MCPVRAAHAPRRRRPDATATGAPTPRAVPSAPRRRDRRRRRRVSSPVVQTPVKSLGSRAYDPRSNLEQGALSLHASSTRHIIPAWALNNPRGNRASDASHRAPTHRIHAYPRASPPCPALPCSRDVSSATWRAANGGSRSAHMHLRPAAAAPVQCLHSRELARTQCWNPPPALTWRHRSDRHAPGAAHRRGRTLPALGFGEMIVLSK